MPWNDDSWRDGYDAWKLLSPDDDYGWHPDDGPEASNDCEMEDGCGVINEIRDDGTVVCPCGGHSWRAHPEDVYQFLQEKAENERYDRQQRRREFWRRLTYPIRWRLWRLFGRIWPRKAIRLLDHDDIPF